MLRVLVLSDQFDEVDELAQKMRAWGHTVRKASDSLAALRLAAEKLPDVLLVDVGMPILDTTEIARQLRLRLPAYNCLIIGLAKRADAACRELSVECGIDLLLEKPVDMTVLETLLMLECAHVSLLQSAP